jgi:hypothetical protein
MTKLTNPLKTLITTMIIPLMQTQEGGGDIYSMDNVWVGYTIDIKATNLSPITTKFQIPSENVQFFSRAKNLVNYRLAEIFSTILWYWGQRLYQHGQHLSKAGEGLAFKAGSSIFTSFYVNIFFREQKLSSWDWITGKSRIQGMQMN